MPETPMIDGLPSLARPTAERPLTGLTLLVVEDSRYASEAVRLMALRSGARLRRADCLRAAERHLQSYRPQAVIVDLGLPDGDGARLIEALDLAKPRIPAILATSGDDDALARATLAGADGLLPKPVASLAVFQETILGALPAEMRPTGLRALSDAAVTPDRLALLEDLARVTEVLEAGETGDRLDYAAHFLSSIARSAQDERLEMAALRLADNHAAGLPILAEMAVVAGMLQERLGDRAAV